MRLPTLLLLLCVTITAVLSEDDAPDGKISFHAIAWVELHAPMENAMNTKTVIATVVFRNSGAPPCKAIPTFKFRLKSSVLNFEATRWIDVKGVECSQDFVIKDIRLELNKAIAHQTLAADINLFASGLTIEHDSTFELKMETHVSRYDNPSDPETEALRMCYLRPPYVLQLGERGSSKTQCTNATVCAYSDVHFAWKISRETPSATRLNTSRHNFAICELQPRCTDTFNRLYFPVNGQLIAITDPVGIEPSSIGLWTRRVVRALLLGCGDNLHVSNLTQLETVDLTSCGQRPVAVVWYQRATNNDNAYLEIMKMVIEEAAELKIEYRIGLSHLANGSVDFEQQRTNFSKKVGNLNMTTTFSIAHVLPVPFRKQGQLMTDEDKAVLANTQKQILGLAIAHVDDSPLVRFPPFRFLNWLMAFFCCGDGVEIGGFQLKFCLVPRKVETSIIMIPTLTLVFGAILWTVPLLQQQLSANRKLLIATSLSLAIAFQLFIPAASGYHVFLVLPLMVLGNAILARQPLQTQQLQKT